MSTIKTLRLRANLTQVQLAEAVGVKQANISHWESGRCFPRRSLWPKLANALNCTVEELLTEKSA